MADLKVRLREFLERAGLLTPTAVRERQAEQDYFAQKFPDGPPGGAQKATTGQGYPYYFKTNPEMGAAGTTELSRPLVELTPGASARTRRHEEEHINQQYTRGWGIDPGGRWPKDADAWTKLGDDDPWWAYRTEPDEMKAYQAGTPGPLGGFTLTQIEELANHFAKARKLEDPSGYVASVREINQKRVEDPLTAALLNSFRK